MSVQLTSDQVWVDVEKNTFGVLGMVTPDGESRTVGIVHVVDDRKLYIGAQTTAWKTRHIARNPHVSLTIPIAKRVPLTPWIKVPAAPITFSGHAKDPTTGGDRGGVGGRYHTRADAVPRKSARPCRCWSCVIDASDKN